MQSRALDSVNLGGGGGGPALCNGPLTTLRTKTLQALVAKFPVFP
jgi:hypothetical protein